MRSYYFKFWAILLTLGLALATHYHNLPALSVPEPPCALCERGGGMWYHAPCALSLSTGRLTELAIYAPHPSLVGEINPVQDWDYPMKKRPAFRKPFFNFLKHRQTPSNL